MRNPVFIGKLSVIQPVDLAGSHRAAEHSFVFVTYFKASVQQRSVIRIVNTDGYYCTQLEIRRGDGILGVGSVLCRNLLLLVLACFFLVRGIHLLQAVRRKEDCEDTKKDHCG